MSYLESKIHEIKDDDFQSLISELCHCVNLGRDQFVDQTLSFLVMSSVREQREMTQNHLPAPGILTRKVNKLSPDSIVYEVCREMADLSHEHIESFDGKTVLSLIKCYSQIFKRKPNPGKSSRRQSAYQFQTDLIDQRRRNGDL